MDLKIGITQTEKLRVCQDSDCQKDHAYQLFPPETVCFVDESFDKRLINEKARSRQIFLTILWNIQFFSRQGLTFWGNNNEIVNGILNNWWNWVQSLTLELFLGWRKSEKSTLIMTHNNIKADTLVTVIKGVSIRLNIPISNARGQCYDGPENMCCIENCVFDRVLSAIIWKWLVGKFFIGKLALH